MNEQNEKSKAPETTPPGELPLCTCFQDPFADLPPDLRPQPKNQMGDLRKVTCPSCGLTYRTNRTIDLCFECEKKGAKQSGG